MMFIVSRGLFRNQNNIRTHLKSGEFIQKLLTSPSFRNYSEINKMEESTLLTQAKACIPALDESKHKGQAGRIGIVGGSFEYTGAPYFAAISALKVGADLSHVFCTKGAAPVIKSYSPELIVHPILDSTRNITDEMLPWIDRLHVMVIGPGLGRDQEILARVSEIIALCRSKCKPLIIDADGLYLVTENIKIIKDYPLPGVILTPNKVEFERLYSVIKNDHENANNINIDYDKLGSHVYIIQKGETDRTYCQDMTKSWALNMGGSGRRCGGQGDLLAGSMATFFGWAVIGYPNTMLAAAVATCAASRLTRLCNEKGFRIKGRSMVCSDMIEQIHTAFDEQFE